MNRSSIPVAAILSCIASGSLAVGQETSTLQSISDVIRRVTPSVVLIRTGGTRIDFRRLPGGKQLEPESAGTGFVIDRQGYILTNNHVVLPHPDWPHPTIRATLSDGRTLEGELVGRDELSDLAVLRVQAAELTPLAFADPQKTAVGQDVIAVGFALFYELEGMPSVTAGVISAFHRSRGELRGENVISLADLVQTDAAVNHGNSDGPLLDMQGEVVGVNTLTASNSQGVHFAISGRLAKPVAQMLIESGAVHRAALGVNVVTISGRTSNWESRAGFSLAEGVFIESVQAASPAAKANLQPFDIIERLGDHRIRSAGDLHNALVWYRPGEQVAVVYRRYPPGKFDPAHYSAQQRDEGERRTAMLTLEK